MTRNTTRLAINVVYIVSSILMLLGGYQMLSGKGTSTLMLGFTFLLVAIALDDDALKIGRRNPRQ